MDHKQSYYDRLFSYYKCKRCFHYLVTKNDISIGLSSYSKVEPSEINTIFCQNVINAIGIPRKKIYVKLMELLIESRDLLDGNKLIEIALRLGFESTQDIYNCILYSKLSIVCDVL